VIELVDGEMVRDERHGGYGDTSSLPSLAPEPERGAAAVAALTAVLEVQRETALSPSSAVSSAYGHGGTADIAARAAATAAAAAVAAVTAAADSSGPRDGTPDASAGDEPAASVDVGDAVADAAPNPPASDSASPDPEAARPRTQPVPIADIAEVEVAELGLADRLGLGETDPDDEVGPTT
jgi:cell division transport system ATP-binding protein